MGSRSRNPSMGLREKAGAAKTVSTGYPPEQLRLMCISQDVGAGTVFTVCSCRKKFFAGDPEIVNSGTQRCGSRSRVQSRISSDSGPRTRTDFDPMKKSWGSRFW